MKKKDIIEFIEERIDHNSPYRPILDTEEMVGARKALVEVLVFLDEVKE